MPAVYGGLSVSWPMSPGAACGTMGRASSIRPRRRRRMRHAPCHAGHTRPSRKEQTVLAHAQPGDAAFAACLRLFRQYPLAVRRHYAEHRYGSMVLMTRDGGASRFFVLIME